MKSIFVRFSVSLSVLILFSISDLQGQQVQVVDAATQLPLADVFIFHSDQDIARFTDKTGRADLTDFPTEGKILFQHPSFKTAETDKKQLTENGFTIALTENILEFAEITISASKWRQSASEVPMDILSIESKAITFNNPQTSADLLSNSGEVFVQKSQLGGGSPTLRGFAANAVLLVVDGVRMNNAIYRSGNLQNVINIDPFIVDQTEVVFGPGSVIYGSDALGGVMEFRTKVPRWSDTGKTKFAGNAALRYGTAANEFTSHFDVTIANKDIAYFGSISYTTLNDLRAGARRTGGFEGHFERNFYAQRVNNEDVLVPNSDPNLQRFSGYNLINALQKVRWRTSDKTSLTYSYFLSTTSDIPRYDRLTLPLYPGSDSLANAEWYYGPQSWQMHSLKFQTFSPTRFYDHMQTTLSFQFYEESRHDRAFGNDLLRSRKEEVDIFTFNNDFEKYLKKGTLYYGVDGFWNGVQSRAQRKNLITEETSRATTRYPDDGSTYYSIALYGNYKWTMGQRWVATAGGRYSLVRLKAHTDNTDALALAEDNRSVDVNDTQFFRNLSLTNQAVTGSLGLVFNPSSNTKVSSVISSGFRAPNIDDVGKIFEVDDRTIVIPNDDLKPEYSYNQEVSLEHGLSESLRFKVVAFHSLLVNAIVRGPVDYGGEQTLSFQGRQIELRSQVNADRARIYGGSARVDWAPSPHWTMSSSLNVNEGRELDNDEPLRHSTPVFGRTSVQYQKKAWTCEVFSDYNATKSADNIPDAEIIDKPHLYTDTGSPGWYTLNLRLGYAPLPYLTVQGGVENIMDKHYRPYSSGISASGRNIYLTLRSSF